MADRTFWKAFFGAAIGKVVIVVFIAICALLGFGPETWAAYMVTELPLWVTPTVAQTAFIALGFSAFLVAFKPWGWLAKSPEKIALGVPQGIIETVGNKSKRMPLIELRDYIVKEPGWEQIREGLQFVDLIKAFREAAHEERFEVWGRKRSPRGGLFESEEILEKIGSDYWKLASLDELRFPDSDENSLLCTHILDINKREQYNSYWDLEVERIPALEWAKSDAARYRGQEDSKSVAVQLQKQAVSFVRDTEMHFALAYIETRRWNIRFADIVMKPGAPDKGFAPVEMRQAALDGDIRIWGRPSQNGPHVLIPAGYWEVWQIDWYSALQSKCRTDIAEPGHYGGSKYYDLMVSKAEVEKKWPPKE